MQNLSLCLYHFGTCVVLRNGRFYEQFIQKSFGDYAKMSAT